MIDVFRRLLSGRIIAAVAGLGTSAFCVVKLESSEYALASVAIAYAAVLSVVLYLPFAKYALISDDTSALYALFWKVQPAIWLLLVAAISVAAFLADDLSHSLLFLVVIFVISQGWRDFAGELLRVQHHIAAVQRLFVFDGFTTLILTVLLVSVWPRAEAMLFASAASSTLWSMVYRPERVTQHPEPARLRDVYMYSSGIVGSNALNAGTLAAARTMLMHSAPPGMAGAIQFLLDLMQKPMALVSSSLNSAVVPVVRRGKVADALPYLLWIFVLSFGGLVVLGLLADRALLFFTARPDPVALALVFACAALVWSNRYKTSVLDLALVTWERGTFLLLIGALAAFGITVSMIDGRQEAPVIAIQCALAILLGGMLNLLIALLGRRIGWVSAVLGGLPVLLPVAVLWGMQAHG